MIHLKMKKYPQIVDEKVLAVKSRLSFSNPRHNQAFNQNQTYKQFRNQKKALRGFVIKSIPCIILVWFESCLILIFQGSHSVVLHKHICFYSSYPLANYCVSFESMACNCWPCSCCCLWLINELVDQTENPLSHWKTRPICLFYPPRAVLPPLINTVQRIIKVHHGKTKKKKLDYLQCHKTFNAVEVCRLDRRPVRKFR